MAGVSIALALAAYFGIGVALAKRDLPRLWEATRESWSLPSSVRESVILMSLVTVLTWPVRVPFLLLWVAVGRAVDQGDPERVQKELADAQQRITELERELGIDE